MPPVPQGLSASFPLILNRFFQVPLAADAYCTVSPDVEENFCASLLLWKPRQPLTLSSQYWLSETFTLLMTVGYMTFTVSVV
jgi:hypothetical protein